MVRGIKPRGTEEVKGMGRKGRSKGRYLIMARKSHAGREMIDIYLYSTGKIEIEPAPDGNWATQLMIFGGKKGHGLLYRCPKAKKRHYLRKIIEARRVALWDEIAVCQKELDKLVGLYVAVDNGEY